MKYLTYEFNQYEANERAIRREDKARRERIKLGKTNPRDIKDK